MKLTSIILLSLLAFTQIVLLVPYSRRLIIELTVYVDMKISGIGGPFDWEYVLRGRS